MTQFAPYSPQFVFQDADKAEQLAAEVKEWNRKVEEAVAYAEKLTQAGPKSQSPADVKDHWHRVSAAHANAALLAERAYDSMARWMMRTHGPAHQLAEDERDKWAGEYEIHDLSARSAYELAQQARAGAKPTVPSGPAAGAGAVAPPAPATGGQPPSPPKPPGSPSGPTTGPPPPPRPTAPVSPTAPPPIPVPPTPGAAPTGPQTPGWVPPFEPPGPIPGYPPTQPSGLPGEPA